MMSIHKNATMNFNTEVGYTIAVLNVQVTIFLVPNLSIGTVTAKVLLMKLRLI